MNVFTMVVCIVAIEAVVQVMKHRTKLALEGSAKNGVLDQKWEARFERLEQRLSNIETIVLEREKHQAFERALS